MNAPDDRPRKKYVPPELVIYGSLRELTGSGANDPPADSIIGGSTQTG
ncbi:MAG TPA: lasso RiPP family leader peptide-containing protein [Thermoanaerobaculia bacterium]